MNVGAQADLRLITLSHLESVLPRAADCGWQGNHAHSALMASFKLM